MIEPINTAIAATNQLLASIRAPHLTVLDMGEIVSSQIVNLIKVEQTCKGARILDFEHCSGIEYDRNTARGWSRGRSRTKEVKNVGLLTNILRACTSTTSRRKVDSIQESYVSRTLPITTQIIDNCLGRILRYLASRHVFEETKPDVFRNNLLSSVMDSGKSVVSIQQEYVLLIG